MKTRNAYPIINLSKKLLSAKSKEEEQSILYHLQIAIDNYENRLITDKDDENIT